MCGIFGFVATDNESRGPNLRRLHTIARATEARGPHAFGFAWIDAHGRLRMFKQTGRISDHLGVLTMAADARILIGHCRYATHGDYRNNLNNHPHTVDGGWLVHNGIIRNYVEICEAYGFAPVTDCDSEVLGLLIEQIDGNLTQRCSAAVEETIGNLAMFALWRNPQRMIAVKRGNPLHLGFNNEGTWLASLGDGLPNARVVPDRSVLSFSLKEGKYVAHESNLPEWQSEPAPFDRSLF